MKKVSILFSTLCLLLFSCNEENVAPQEESVLEQDTKTITIIYKSSSYVAKMDANGDIDKSGFGTDILNAMENSYVVELSEENVIHLFDTEGGMETFISKKADEFGTSDMTGARTEGVATSTGYQHWHFGGFPLAGSGNFAYPSLRPHGFNDLISSAIVSNYSSSAYLAQFYEHDNYGGYVYNIIVSPGAFEYRSNFRNFSFNDETSSMRGRYI